MTAPSEILGVEDYITVADGVIIRPMLTVNRGVDLYLGDLQRSGRRDRTCHTYSRILSEFVDHLPTDHEIAKVTADDCRRYLDRHLRKSRGTQAQVFSILNGFFKWAVFNQKIKVSPMERMMAPRRLPPESLDVTTVSTEDVRKLLAAARGWTEKLSVALPAYMGCRRHAAAQLRVKDYNEGWYIETIDEETGEPVFGRKPVIRFVEKGGKTIWKPVPDELADMLDARLKFGAEGWSMVGETRQRVASGRSGVGPDPTSGAVLKRTRASGEMTGAAPEDYLIPSESSSRKGERDDRVVWKAVKRAGERAGVEVHVHALRAAFAVFFLEQNHGDLEALQPLMGHRDISTTQVYLRKLDRGAAMDRVRTLSWGNSRLVEGDDHDARVGSSTEQSPAKSKDLA